MELQERLDELESAGIGAAAISYDSPAVLADFAQRRGIDFPLLSDEESEVIARYGILNTVAEEALEEGSDDPDLVAEVARYVSVFGAGQLFVGTPYPGTFIVDGEGRVTSRYFEEFYRERNTTTNVLLKEGIGVSPIEAIEGSSPQLDFTAWPSNTLVGMGTRFSIVIEVRPGENMHVYAPGAEGNGYRVIGLELAPSDMYRLEPVEFPESEIYYFAPLDEYVPVFQEPFTILQEVVMAATPETEETLGDMETITLSGFLNYQACDDAICYLPQSVPISFVLDTEGPDRLRALR